MNIPPTDSAVKFGDRFGFKLLLLVVLATAAVFVWTSRHYQQQAQQQDTWLDEQGRLHVLGITLGTSDLRQAELALQSRSEVALYLYPVEHPKAGMKLEAYFPAIADHTQIILLLDASPDMLKQMGARASTPQQFESQVARLALASADAQSAMQLPVNELTMIPSVSLTQANLNARFGIPASITHPTPTSTVLGFPALGLVAELNEGEAPQLHFSNPEKTKH
ncbi:MAG: hypothetical protein HY849_10315 [Nitrosomonadales bacterium]|nr:hypothetical protein [Nitrosomonadales bacterium]